MRIQMQTSLSPIVRAVSCPYSDLNLNKDGLVPDRLSGERPVTLSGPPRHRRAETLTQTQPPTPTPTPSASTPDPPDTTTDTCPQARAVREHIVWVSAVMYSLTFLFHTHTHAHFLSLSHSFRSGSAPKCVKPPQVKQEGDGKGIDTSNIVIFWLN